ncbi:glycoside hydrolase family 61 protein [Mollisia scopiformis]|uniref:AA9 family lytic polysaccharide monooxygenase n=1 Tax=Mollisia scopiformis TaxID=149040 RepID=A0A194XDC3_MOLSC|nr:glycoside hydrolase family 61 protein [Mollisia scopiformis]KUJ18154.1 glycoside hydrolase family 61 protein [Mollisia scopiformis]
MKVISTCAAILAFASQVSSHYIFQSLTANGVKNAAYTYVRRNTNYNSPVTDLTSKDLICNVGGASGSNTTTVSVKAGASLSFTADIAVYHQGPISVYMAKAPTTAAEFDGTGQVWFKIFDEGPKFPGGTWDLKQTYTFNLPTCVPSGDYLVRIQSLAIHNPYPGGTPQFYVGCAQVTVTGGGSTELGPKVTIPGFITKADPGYTANIYSNFNSYTIPGPAVAKC